MNRNNSSFTTDVDDISDADQNDIQKILKDTDDLEDTLFKKQSSTKSQETSGLLSKTLPAALDKKSNLASNKSFDDALDDMDSFFGKTAPPKASRSVSFNPRPAAQNQTFRNLSNPGNFSKKNQLSFDDDDFFQNETKQATIKKSNDDDLDIFKPSLSHESKEPPASSGINDTSFKFGEYMPTLGTSRSTSKQDQFKRNESFSFDDDDVQDRKLASAKTSSSGVKSSTLKNDLDLGFDFESLLKPKASAVAGHKKPPVEQDKSNWLEESKPVADRTSVAPRNRTGQQQQQLIAPNEPKPSLNDTFDSVTSLPPAPLKFDPSKGGSSRQSGGFDFKDTDSKPVSRKPTLDNNFNLGSADSQNLMQKIQQLEFEVQELNMQLSHQKSHYESKITLTNETCEERIKMMREDRETLVRHHNEAKSALQTQIDMLAKQKNEIAVTSKQKLDEREREFEADLEKQRQSYRESIDRLKADYQEQIERLKRSHEAEKRSMMELGHQSNTIENVVGMIEGQARSLNEMQMKVERGHASNLREVEVQLRAKEELLKAHENRLTQQQKEYETEIRVLNETIRKLEAHLAEQIKNVEEERWRSKQQEKKLEALQEALVNEQRLVMDKFARERHEIDRTKEDTLAEQKRLVKQIYEEKCRIAEEKANLDAAIAAYKDKMHKDSLANISNEAEMSVNSKRLKDEQVRLEQVSADLKEKESRLKRERAELDERRHELDVKVSNLEKMALNVHQKYFEAEELFSRANREKDAQQRILDEVNAIKQGHENRLHQIQQQMNILREKENEVNQEKLEVYRQRQVLEQIKTSITCTKCKEPLRNHEFPGFAPPQNYFNQTLRPFPSISPLTASINSSEIEDTKNLRQLKIQAYRDKQFLNEEKQFIEAINGFGLKSMSMSRLNTTIG